MPKVKIPGPLRKLLDNRSEINVEGKTLKEVIEKLAEINPEVRSRILDENGEIRRFINVYVNNEDVRFMDGVNTKVDEDDEITIVPAIAGGVI